MAQCFVAAQPLRWLLAEELETYRAAFGLIPAEPAAQQAAATGILARYLATHALVSLRDVLDRYPFEPPWARQRLEEWAASGRVIALRSWKSGNTGGVVR